MSLEIKGRITLMKDVQKGTSKSGKDWQKQEFVVETDETYNNIYCFEVFGDEKVENLTKYNKVGDEVTVQFNVNTNEWKGKHFTSLAAWRIEKSEGSTTDEPPVSNAPLPDAPSDLTSDDDCELPF